jgi:hypothetical protein
MKKYLIAAIAVVCLALAAAGLAAGKDRDKTCSPTNITYCRKDKTLLGTPYKTYNVRCSDGTKRTITAWDNRKKWCVGTTSRCTKDQLETAKQACQTK